MKAMILAAGRGTRLKPLTNHKPKALVEVNGTPMLELLIRRLKKSGFDEILINIHHFGGQIMDFVRQNRNFGMNISFSDERDRLLDTGGAVLKAAHFFKGEEPVLLHNVDVFSQMDLREFYNRFKKSHSIAALVVRRRETNRKLLFDHNMRLTGWKNRTTGAVKQAVETTGAPSEFAYSGIWICSPQFPEMIPFTGRFSIVDAWLAVAKEHPVTGFIDDSPLWFDLGSPEKIGEAEKRLFTSGL